MRLDPSRLPHAAKYFNSLPNGLESFPNCKVIGEAWGPFTRNFGRLAAEPALPKTLSDLLVKPISEKSWVSEVTFQTVNLAIRDLAFGSDAEFHKWTYSSSQELFDKPFVKHLMRLVSPTLVIAGGKKRWSAFRQGSELTTSPVEESGGRLRTIVGLTYPNGVFPTLFLETLTQSFLAAVAGARAKDPRVELGATTPGRTEYRISYSV